MRVSKQRTAHEAQCTQLHEDWAKDGPNLRALELQKVEWEYRSKLQTEEQRQIEARRERIDDGSAISVAARLGDLPLEMARVLDTHENRYRGVGQWLQAEIRAVKAMVNA